MQKSLLGNGSAKRHKRNNWIKNNGSPRDKNATMAQMTNDIFYAGRAEILYIGLVRSVSISSDMMLHKGYESKGSVQENCCSEPQRASR
jgi:hypothetical protein